MIDRRLNYGRSRIRAFLEEARPFRSVLDLGAGHGDDLLLARAVAPEAKLHALETEPSCQAELRALGVEVFAQNLERDRLPFADGAVDVVVMNQVLEHVKEVFWILHEVSRVLPVGGSLLLGVPNLASLHNRLLLLAGRQPSPIKTASAHVRGFTRGDVLHFLESGFPGGYAVRGFAGSNFYPLPARLAEPLSRGLPTLAWAIFFRLVKQRAYDGGFLRFPAAQKLETDFYLG